MIRELYKFILIGAAIIGMMLYQATEPVDHAKLASERLGMYRCGSACGGMNH